MKWMILGMGVSLMLEQNDYFGVYLPLFNNTYVFISI